MITVGSRIQLIKDIYDDGCDNHHPPGYLAYCGDELIVRKVYPDGDLGVSHEWVTDTSFTVFDGEYSPQLLLSY